VNLQEGDQFGHYQIRSHIAQGGTGDVYRAVDVLTGCEVALKIPTRTTILDPRQYDFFLREVEAMRILRHQAVQRGIESGNWEATPYLVTELIVGKSLRTILKEMGAFPADRAIELVCEIAKGSHHCHEQKVVHRDLKPENILIAKDDQPIIIDFGLSLTEVRPTGGKTAGTPEYMAPEQVEGQLCDKRTDIYALGIILYELLAGETPFRNDDPLELVNMHLYSAVPRLDRVVPGVTRELATVIAKCLQRDPDGRYPDMCALISDLNNLSQVDPTQLEKLCAKPPGKPFHKTQFGQVFLTTAAMVLGIAVLAIVLLSIKH
jgi:serine/threonine-protein kinase